MAEKNIFGKKIIDLSENKPSNSQKYRRFPGLHGSLARPTGNLNSSEASPEAFGPARIFADIQGCKDQWADNHYTLA